MDTIALELDLIANRIRKTWAYPNVLLSKDGGFQLDLVKAIIKAGATLEGELQRVSAPADAIKLLKKTASKMNAAAKTEWHYATPTSPTSSLREQMAVRGHAELQNWNAETLEGRMALIFKYLNSVGLPNYNDWCASFVSWVISQLTDPTWDNSSRPSDSNTQDLKGEFLADLSGRSTYLPAKQHPTPKVGDIVFFKRRKKPTQDFGSVYGHVGIVVSVAAEEILAVEGNSGQTLGIHKYSSTFTKSDLHQYDGLVRLK